MEFEKYDVVKPYINNIIYTNPEQKLELMKFNNINCEDWAKNIHNIKNTSNKRLFTISGGIVAMTNKLLCEIGGFNEINSYGYEDRFMDVHILNKLKYNFIKNFSMKELSNKTAIITGGSKGIGKGIVKKFAKEGCNIAFS